MTEQVLYGIGQGLGILAVILGFASYQMKRPKGIILLQLATAMVFAAHYYLIGAFTATVLNFLSGLQCIGYYFRDRQGKRGLWMPVAFVALVLISGVLTWEKWYSVLLMAGLIVNTLGLSLKDPQNTRKLVLIKSPLCLVYNLLVHSVGGVIYECAVLTSAVIGLVKYGRSKEVPSH